MPFDEMTITLDDVGTILGIRLTGRSVSADLLLHEAAIDLVSSQPGVSRPRMHTMSLVVLENRSLDWSGRGFLESCPIRTQWKVSAMLPQHAYGTY